MANLPATGGSGGSGGSVSQAGTPTTQFSIHGAATFVPYYSPKHIVETKERTPGREENFCDGEDVSDNGSKNREIQIQGKVLSAELNNLEALGDADESLTLSSELFSGEVYVMKVKRETTSQWNPHMGQMMYKYVIRILSSGRDEGHSMSTGIIAGGNGGGSAPSNSIGAASGNTAGPRGNR